MYIPFSGSKRYNFKTLKKFLKGNDKKYKTVLEPFGGSAVLSVNLKHHGIIDEAIINDFDGIFDIYEEFLDIKDELIKKCFAFGFEKTKGTLTKTQREKLQEEIRKIDPKFHHLLANNFVFSARRAGQQKIEIRDFRYFMNDTTTDMARAFYEVIKKIKLEKLDFKDFYKKHRNINNSLWVVDPPYISSSQSQYNNKDYFGFKKTKELIDLIKDTNQDAVLYASERHVIEHLLTTNNMNFKLLDKKKKRTSNRSNDYSEFTYFIERKDEENEKEKANEKDKDTRNKLQNRRGRAYTRRRRRHRFISSRRTKNIN